MQPNDFARARGALGEELACRFLESRGYAIVERNLRIGRGELDIVARRGNVSVAVEVKWRRWDSGRGDAVDAWRPHQRVRASQAMLAWLAQAPDAPSADWRFDLITIDERPDGWTLTHRRGAWSPSGSFW